jgi:polyadenylate-binding protein
MESEYQMPQEPDQDGPQPHPILHEPLLYISNIPPYVSDENIALAFVSCGPFRPKIPRDGSNNPLNGTIEFKFLDKGGEYSLVKVSI